MTNHIAKEQPELQCLIGNEFRLGEDVPSSLIVKVHSGMSYGLYVEQT
jgi:hypothetical protein